MTTLTALDLAMQVHAPGIRLRDLGTRDQPTNHRNLMRLAECDIPGWGTVHLAEHPSQRLQLRSRTPHNGPRAVQIADLHGSLPAESVAWLLAGLATYA